jgi:hypothetical protein
MGRHPAADAIEIKVAAQAFPMFRFVSCEKNKGLWVMK